MVSHPGFDTVGFIINVSDVKKRINPKIKIISNHNYQDVVDIIEKGVEREDWIILENFDIANKQKADQLEGVLKKISANKTIDSAFRLWMICTAGD
eukprot:UC4_evm1s661